MYAVSPIAPSFDIGQVFDIEYALLVKSADSVQANGRLDDKEALIYMNTPVIMSNYPPLTNAGDILLVRTNIKLLLQEKDRKSRRY
jgi:hypothetical protein